MRHGLFGASYSSGSKAQSVHASFIHWYITLMVCIILASVTFQQNDRRNRVFEDFLLHALLDSTFVLRPKWQPMCTRARPVNLKIECFHNVKWMASNAICIIWEIERNKRLSNMIRFNGNILCVHKLIYAVAVTFRCEFGYIVTAKLNTDRMWDNGRISIVNYKRYWLALNSIE